MFKLSIALVLITLVSCKPASYFITPNDVLAKDGIVYMLNGTEKKGKISVMVDTGLEPDKFIRLKVGDSTERILIDSIQSYYINGDYYFPKVVALDFGGTQALLFVKRLTKENSRIHLYELKIHRSNTNDGSDLIAHYISLGTHKRLETWLVGDKHLIPNFEEKMSKIVEDCIILSNKIKQKDKGYFISGLTLSLVRLETLKRIINEYNNCH